MDKKLFENCHLMLAQLQGEIWCFGKHRPETLDKLKKSFEKLIAEAEKAVCKQNKTKLHRYRN